MYFLFIIILYKKSITYITNNINICGKGTHPGVVPIAYLCVCPLTAHSCSTTECELPFFLVVWVVWVLLTQLLLLTLSMIMMPLPKLLIHLKI